MCVFVFVFVREKERERERESMSVFVFIFILLSEGERVDMCGFEFGSEIKRESMCVFLCASTRESE